MEEFKEEESFADRGHWRLLRDILENEVKKKRRRPKLKFFVDIIMKCLKKQNQKILHKLGLRLERDSQFHHPLEKCQTN